LPAQTSARRAIISMQEAEIRDYARQLLEAHGDKALRRPLRRLVRSKRRATPRKPRRGAAL